MSDSLPAYLLKDHKVVGMNNLSGWLTQYGSDLNSRNGHLGQREGACGTVMVTRRHAGHRACTSFLGWEPEFNGLLS